MSDEKREDVPQPAEEESQTPLMIDEDSADEGRSVGGRGRNRGADEDDETWTNQPNAAEQDLGEDDDQDEEDDSEEDSEPARAPRKAIETGRDVVCEELPDRAQRAAVRLKPVLTATVVFDFNGSGEKYLFDWRGDVPTTKHLPKSMAITCNEEQGYQASDNAINVDTVICISESHLMSVRSGSLNPQVGMLTDKIRIKGKVGPAVYIFNLVAPRART